VKDETLVLTLFFLTPSNTMAMGTRSGAQSLLDLDPTGGADMLCRPLDPARTPRPSTSTSNHSDQYPHTQPQPQSQPQPQPTLNQHTPSQYNEHDRPYREPDQDNHNNPAGPTLKALDVRSVSAEPGFPLLPSSSCPSSLIPSSCAHLLTRVPRPRLSRKPPSSD
jgi:hypothetical protein